MYGQVTKNLGMVGILGGKCVFDIGGQISNAVFMPENSRIIFNELIIIILHKSDYFRG
jgi:hypothetical protein